MSATPGRSLYGGLEKVPPVQKEMIGGKAVYLVEDHHHVLLPWREICGELGVLPHVLTLDHHTDTLPAFTHFNEVNGCCHPLHIPVEEALCDLRHDEHFDFAVRNGIIRSATIFSHVNFAVDVNPALTIVHDPPADDTAETLENYYAAILESDFLRRNLQQAPLPHGVPYILDIDLDCFKGIRSIMPEDPGVFQQLVRNASAVTICRERDWVRLLNLDFGKLQYGFFLEKLLLLIRNSGAAQGVF